MARSRATGPPRPELYALLSALADVPINQSFAVTGSVNQHGEIQPIGGVNEKIEGFFDVCRMRGLSGEQGVLIPASNVRHLMLRQDVVAACAQGKFHIYPVDSVDEGIELLTGFPAGVRDTQGISPRGQPQPSRGAAAHAACRDRAPSAPRRRRRRNDRGRRPPAHPAHPRGARRPGASLAALDAAARLAEQMEAELLGLFVEDVNLLRLAGLPFAREVGLTLAHARPLASADMERALRAQALRAQQALEQAATRLSVRCSFRVVRGQVTEELLAAAEEADLVAIGLSRQTLSRARPGTTAGAMAAGTKRPMLFLPRDATVRPPVMVIYNGSAAGERALALAMRLAQAEQWPLTVWIAGRTKSSGKSCKPRRNGL